MAGVENNVILSFIFSFLFVAFTNTKKSAGRRTCPSREIEPKRNPQDLRKTQRGQTHQRVNMVLIYVDTGESGCSYPRHLPPFEVC
jgi:hypothetical protein